MKKSSVFAMGAALLLGGVWWARAQNENPNNAPRIVAQIAAPAQINLEAAQAFPVQIRGRIYHNGSRPLETIKIQAPGAWIFSEEKMSTNGALDVPAKYTLFMATIRLRPAATKDKNEYKFIVTPVDNPQQVLDTATIKLRRAASIEAVAPPEFLWAKSKTPERLRFLVRDQHGQPLDNVPCLARYILQPPNVRLTKQEKIIPACSDAQGIVTIELPMPKTAGLATLQVSGGEASSQKVECLWRLMERPQ